MPAGGEWFLAIKLASKTVQAAEEVFKQAEDQAVHHTEHGLSMEEAEEKYLAAKKELDNAEAEKDRLLNPS